MAAGGVDLGMGGGEGGWVAGGVVGVMGCGGGGGRVCGVGLGGVRVLVVVSERVEVRRREWF